MKPKEWLYKNGHIKKEDVNRRGRLSGAHKSLIEAAVAKGEKIDGYAVVGKPTAQTDKPASVERVKHDPNRLVDVPDMRRDEREWSASVTVDGKTLPVGFRTVCNGCGNSLGWCYEETSRVWVDSNREAVVTFKPQKGAV